MNNSEKQLLKAAIMRLFEANTDYNSLFKAVQYFEKDRMPSIEYPITKKNIDQMRIDLNFLLKYIESQEISNINQISELVKLAIPTENELLLHAHTFGGNPSCFKAGANYIINTLKRLL